MNYSAQAIIIDEDSNIYLERNAKIWSLSFIWWALEKWEDYISALMREVHEELWLIISGERFIEWKQQPKRIFLTWEWESMYFLCILQNDEVSQIKKLENIEVYDFSSLERLTDNDFPLERVSFLQEVQRALDCLDR